MCIRDRSYGLELQTDWKPNDFYAFALGYTRTESYDGTTCDDPDASGGPGSAACNDEMNVRVPRNQINFSGVNAFSNNLTQTINIKYVGERRDYGNTNNSFEDVILSNYLTADYILNYKLFDTYNVNISARNITDKRYSEAFEYKAPGRSFNFMIGRSF